MCVYIYYIFMQVMKEFAFCIGKGSTEVTATLKKNWSVWISKIVQKAQLETSHRNTLFQGYSGLIDRFSTMTPEELPQCESI